MIGIILNSFGNLMFAHACMLMREKLEICPVRGEN